MEDDTINQHEEFRSHFKRIMGPFLRMEESEFLYEAALCDLLAGKLVIIRKKPGCFPVAESR